MTTSIQRRGLMFGVAMFAAALLASGAISAAALPRPTNLDRSLDRLSDHSLFRIRMQSGTSPVPLLRVHQWTLHLSTVDGKPVSGAEVKVDGGMPQHHHGLPTAPRAAPAGSPGDYVISGMKFSMDGWWVLKLAIRTPDGRADSITFNVVL